ncbi:MAG: PD-(D/E)XK nuclease family protein [Oscillatoria sp. SIO1A7]|nr:PD-(D/E)XK nuclease family protein [Oscillatoria sp. SIO1A7]
MPYHLSATKLQNYHQCPRAYYYQYERGLVDKKSFGAPAFGRTLHKALEKFYWNWHYNEPKPPVSWMVRCWESVNGELSGELQYEGQDILENYYYEFVATLDALKKPFAVEGRISALVSFCNVEFKITGRYDRLDWLDDGLELIDYKSSKNIKIFEDEEIDLQLGLYYLALEKTYHRALKQMSLIYLRHREVIPFEVTPARKEEVEREIGELAGQLRLDTEWETNPGEHCGRCTYRQYCPAVTENPEPLPENAKQLKPLQLSLL